MSLPRYAEYKDSGVVWFGEVPAHWSTAPLGTLSLSVQTGPFGSQLHSEDYVEGETPVINPSNIQNGKLVADLSCTVPAQIVERLSRHKLTVGDIVFGRRGEMGRCAMVTTSEEGWLCGTGSLNVRLGHKALPEFVSNFLGTSYVKELLKLDSVGSTMDNLNTAILSRVQVPTPPLDEQSAIADFLDREAAKIDALIAEQEKLLALLAEKRQATISHAVTRGLDPSVPMKDSGIPWLGDTPAHWRVVPLKYLVSLRSGGTPSKESLDYWDGDVPWASAKDLKCEFLGDTTDHLTQLAVDSGAASLLPAGVVLVVVRGMILARTFPVVETLVPMAINQDLKALLPNPGMHASYLAWLLRGTAAESLQRLDEAGHGTKALRMEAWTSLALPVPPKGEQHEIVEALLSKTKAIDDLVAECAVAIALLQERRSALISAAVTGKIDVRGLVQEIA